MIREIQDDAPVSSLGSFWPAWTLALIIARSVTAVVVFAWHPLTTGTSSLFVFGLMAGIAEAWILRRYVRRFPSVAWIIGTAMGPFVGVAAAIIVVIGLGLTLGSLEKSTSPLVAQFSNFMAGSILFLAVAVATACVGIPQMVILAKFSTRYMWWLAIHVVAMTTLVGWVFGQGVAGGVFTSVDPFQAWSWHDSALAIVATETYGAVTGLALDWILAQSDVTRGVDDSRTFQHPHRLHLYTLGAITIVSVATFLTTPESVAAFPWDIWQTR